MKRNSSDVYFTIEQSRNIDTAEYKPGTEQIVNNFLNVKIEGTYQQVDKRVIVGKQKATQQMKDEVENAMKEFLNAVK